MEYDKSLPMTEFDKVTVPKNLQMAKAVIPFLDTSTKKMFSIFIRFQEMMQTLEFFNKTFHAESAGTFHRTNYTINDIIKETMPYCSKNMADMFGMFQNYMNMYSMFNMYKDMDQSQDFQNIINIVNGMKESESDNQKNSDSTTQTGKQKSSKATVNRPEEMSAASFQKVSDLLAGDTDYLNSPKQPKSQEAPPSKSKSDSKPPTDNSSFNVLNNMMNTDQKELYEKFLKEIDDLNFDNSDQNES